MPDDKNISRLISKSLHQNLEGDESHEVEEHLSKNEQSKQFADLSRLTHNSVALAADESESGNAELGPCLSAEAKERLMASVAEAKLEKESLLRSGLIETSISMAIPDDSGWSQATIDSNPGQPSSPNGQRRVTSQFRLIRKLGEGGLGKVWLARDEKLNRNVAIKELKRGALESTKAWNRFHRKAAVTGRLEHPNIVPLYLYGNDRDSSEPFYAMRFVGKRTLSDAIVEYHDRVEAQQEDGTLGLHRLLTVFLDVCQAIAYAHSRGVVHRDIKPENIALDNFDQVVVLDWGLAKLLEDGEIMQQMTASSCPNDAPLHQTLASDVIGTPHYMAPEQARGEHVKVNRQTDVYGLGAVLFAILSGKAPYEDTAVEMAGKSISEIVKAISKKEAPKVFAVKNDVPLQLDAICQRAMSNKQHLRYASVADLAGEVERWMAGQSEKRARYENLRMEGRELRADMQSFVNDAERNVRFMSHLPPIQEIITADSDETISAWRGRLVTIFRGLLGANPDYQSVIYSEVNGSQYTELARVERHSKEHSSIRSLPKSRLKNGESSDYIVDLSAEKPEEVLVSLVCDPTCDKAEGCEDTAGLVAGIPVYDDRTEELFGVVMIVCNIDRVLKRQLSRGGLKAGEIVTASDIFHVVAQFKAGTLRVSNYDRVSDVAPHFLLAVEALQTQDEFIDDSDADIYGARIWFTPKKHGLMYLLKRSH